MSIHYGKAAVSVYRTDGQSTLFAAEIAIDVLGEQFWRAYTEGDNTLIVPTDTMKNFIHASALDYEGDSLEEFLERLGRRFLGRYEHAERVRLQARELPFAREGAGLYRRLGGDHAVAELEIDRAGLLDHRSGLDGLRLVKLTGSSFVGFVRDEYTTLPEMEDRPLLVHLNARWRHHDFGRRVPAARVRASLAATFEAFVSNSIQHLIHEMGRRLLDEHAAIAEVSFKAENHLWDTAQVSSRDPRVKVYTDPRPPYGIIGLTLKR